MGAGDPCDGRHVEWLVEIQHGRSRCKILRGCQASDRESSSLAWTLKYPILAIG